MPTPGHPDATLARLLEAKGPLTANYAVLCTADWLLRHPGRRDVTVAEVRAAYPRPRGPHAPAIPSPGQALQRCATAGLLELVVTLTEPDARTPTARGRAARPAERRAYRLTPMGRAVVEALPDLERVGALRGMGHAAPGRGRAPSARAEPGERQPTRRPRGG